MGKKKGSLGPSSGKRSRLLGEDPIPGEVWRFAELWHKEVEVSVLSGSSVLKYYLWKEGKATCWCPNDIDLFTVDRRGEDYYDEDWVESFLHRNKFTYDEVDSQGREYWMTRPDVVDRVKIRRVMNVHLAEPDGTAFKLQITCIDGDVDERRPFGEIVVKGFDIDICKGFVVPDGERVVTWMDDTMAENARNGRFACFMGRYPSFKRMEKYIRRGFRPVSVTFAQDIVLRVESAEVRGVAL